MVRVLLFISMLFSVMTSFAQETLNIHTKENGVVSIPFAQKPEILFVGTNIFKVVSAEKSVEFSFGDIEKLSFDNASLNNINQIVHHGNKSSVFIYNLSGKLVRKIEPSDNLMALNIQSLPSGVYIVKEGHQSYKIIIK